MYIDILVELKQLELHFCFRFWI